MLSVSVSDIFCLEIVGNVVVGTMRDSKPKIKDT